MQFYNANGLTVHIFKTLVVFYFKLLLISLSFTLSQSVSANDTETVKEQPIHGIFSDISQVSPGDIHLSFTPLMSVVPETPYLTHEGQDALRTYEREYALPTISFKIQFNLYDEVLEVVLLKEGQAFHFPLSRDSFEVDLSHISDYIQNTSPDLIDQLGLNEAENIEPLLSHVTEKTIITKQSSLLTCAPVSCPGGQQKESSGSANSGNSSSNEARAPTLYTVSYQSKPDSSASGSGSPPPPDRSNFTKSIPVDAMGETEERSVINRLYLYQLSKEEFKKRGFVTEEKPDKWILPEQHRPNLVKYNLEKTFNEESRSNPSQYMRSCKEPGQVAYYLVRRQRVGSEYLGDSENKTYYLQSDGKYYCILSFEGQEEAPKDDSSDDS